VPPPPPPPNKHELLGFQESPARLNAPGKENQTVNPYPSARRGWVRASLPARKVAQSAHGLVSKEENEGGDRSARRIPKGSADGGEFRRRGLVRTGTGVRAVFMRWPILFQLSFSKFEYQQRERSFSILNFSRLAGANLPAFFKANLVSFLTLALANTNLLPLFLKYYQQYFKSGGSSCLWCV
jgi:hypothetical protein